MYKMDLEKADEPEIKLPTSVCWIIEKAREFPKNIYFCFIDYTEAFVWITTNCGIFLNRWEYKTTLPASCMQDKKQVRIGHETMDWFIIGKGVHKGCILSPCLFKFYAEYIMQNAGLDDSQAGIKISRRNINSLRHEADTTLMTESEELKSLLRKVKEESEKASLKLNIQNHGIQSHHFLANRWGNSENSVRFHFLGLHNHCGW